MSDAKSPRTLELRIHGVNNTAPANMLGLREDQIERLVGDELGGFWRAKPDVLDRLEPGDRGYTPPIVHREAYSWGGLARNSVGVADSGFIASVSRALIRIGWVLLLPFGLCNVAYWSRRLRGGQEPPAGPGVIERGVSARSSAGMTRLFGLALTLLTVFTACEVAMDLVAKQCYRTVDVGGVTSTVQVCENLPSWFDILRREPPTRLVIASVVPLLLLGGLYYLSAVSRLRFERVSSTAYKALGVNSRPSHPIISTPGFWSSTRMTSGLARLHLAAGIAAVSIALAGPALFGAGEACDIRNVGNGLDTCWDQITDDPGRSATYAPSLILAFITIAATAVLIWRRTGDAPDLPGTDDVIALRRTQRWTFVALAGSIAVLVATEVLLLTLHPAISDEIALPGVNSAPTILAIVLTGLAWGALTWRIDRLAHLWAFLLIGGLLASVLWDAALLLVVSTVVIILVRLVSIGRNAPVDRRWTAWRGAAPGILLGGSLIAALTLTSLVILVTGDWLNGNNNAATLIAHECEPALATGVVSTANPCLEVPTAYVLFGGAMAVALVILTLVLVAVLVKTARGRSIGVGLELEPPPTVPVPPFDQSRRDARRWAGCAHRAEKLIAVLVMMGMAAILLMLSLAAARWIPDFGDDHLTGWVAFSKRVVGAGTLAFAFVGLLLVGAAIGGKGKQRPLGLLWDLVCFLPRAAHPFAPSCYAERAVPELVGRCDWWLQSGDEKAVDGRRGDTIVLSAHSLGSVLAVASLFSMTQRPSTTPQPPTFRLITYGSQLRAYFGRIFPELLGPSILGISPVTSSRLWTTDPWQNEVGTPPSDLDATADTLVNRLRVSPDKPLRWLNLWRRTDYLGFPVHAYQPNDIDVRASELDETGYQTVIGTHSDYPNTTEYAEALERLS